MVLCLLKICAKGVLIVGPDTCCPELPPKLNILVVALVWPGINPFLTKYRD